MRLSAGRGGTDSRAASPRLSGATSLSRCRGSRYSG